MATNPVSNYNLSLSFWKLALQYVSLSENIAHETGRQGDTRFLICDIQDIPEDSKAYYFDKTKWSDFNVGIPMLFVAYYGFELLLKGFLIQAGVKVNRDTLRAVR